MNTNDTNNDITLLTPQQVADLLAIPTSTLSRWRTERREIPLVTVGRVIRSRRRYIRWLDENTVEV